jgi:hypothetical protein
MQQALEQYVPRNNTMLFECLDELLKDISLGEPPKAALTTHALGKYHGDLDGLSGEMKRALADDDLAHLIGRRS